MQKYTGVGQKLDLSDGYIVVMQHPVTTEYSQAQTHVEHTLEAVSQLNLPVLWFWPNVDAGSDGTSSGIRRFREQNDVRQFHFFKNMAPHDFLRLLINSRCLVGNSSVGIRECAYLGVPAVNIGSRQAGRQRGRNVIDVSYNRDEIVDGIQRHLSNGRYACDPIYGNGAAGQEIAKVLSKCPLTIEKRLAY
jgi:UDP-hydrolysing UDP-N-acetyl-D-glucosamine 2-epimerase